MGLDFSHCDAHWSYSGFNHFRDHLAREVGISLDLMQGFTDDGLSWDKCKDDIVPLLHHSDCDGELSPEECQIIAPRLRELVADWSNDRWKDDCYDKRQALLLAVGMEECAAKGEALSFC